MPSLTKKITIGSDVEKRILRAIRARKKACDASEARMKFRKKWQEAEDKVVGYLPERSVDAMRRREREQGKAVYTTIQIPYSAAVMLASHTYWTTVFLNRSPVIQLQGLHGEGEQQVLAVEALMNYQTNVGGHLPVYHTWLYDAGKYGHGIVGTYWDEELITVGTIIEQPAPVIGGITVGKSKKVKETREIKGYEGNRLFNIRPVDFFHDPRVTVANFQQGEFCGYWVSISWSKLVDGERSGMYMNTKKARDKAMGRRDSRNTYTNVLDIPDTGDFGSHHIDGELAGDSLACYEFYIELSPKEWGLGSSERFEKWVFIVTELFDCVLSARPLGSYHNKFPFAVLKGDPEGYSVYTPGIPDQTKDIQHTIDWLINSHFYNVRKTMNNEFIVDPSRVEMSDVLNPLPGGIIRLKPAAYGQDTKMAITQLSTTDVTRGHLTDMDMMLGLGERVTGVNDSIMGIANPSSRRSATEVRSSNSFSVNRLKTTSEYFSAMGFSPLSQMMVQNSQQYYSGEKKYALAGNASLLAGERFLNVTPEAIAGFYEYVPVDGALPVDRFAQANLWRALMGEMRQIPPLMQQYDVAKIFGYVAQLTGLKNVEQFRIEVVPDGLLQDQAQQGNVVPLGVDTGSSPQTGELGPSL